MEVPPGQLPPVGGLPKLALRRQKDENYNMDGSRPSGFGPRRKKRKGHDSVDRPGGPVSASAIGPTKRSEPSLVQQESGSETLFEKSAEPSPESKPEVVRSPESSATEADRRSESRPPGRS